MFCRDNAAWLARITDCAVTTGRAEDFAETTDKFSLAAVLVAKAASASREVLSRIVSGMKPHGELIVSVTEPTGSDSDAIEMAMRLCGLLNIISADDACTFIGKKPDVMNGAAFALRRRGKDMKDTLRSLASREPASLVSDANLLEEEDRVKPMGYDAYSAACGPSAVETGSSQPAKKKACKNCTCGLKEEEEQASDSAAVQPDTTNAKSSCGSVRRVHVANSELTCVVLSWGRLSMRLLSVPRTCCLQAWRAGAVVSVHAARRH